MMNASIETLKRPAADRPRTADGAIVAEAVFGGLQRVNPLFRLVVEQDESANSYVDHHEYSPSHAA